jgi:hypothetical protein
MNTFTHLLTRPLVIIAVLTIASLTDAVAQEQLPLEPGQRVRLVLGSLWCPLTDVTRLEVHAGRRAFTGRGALIGAGAGILVGIPVGIIEQSRYDCDPENAWAPCIPPGPTIPLMFGLLGAGLGALTGSFIKTDRWEEVPLDRLQVSIAPSRNGIGIGARIAF